MRLAVLASLAFLVACGASHQSSKKLAVDGKGHKVVLLAGISDVSALKEQAEALGLKAQGDVVVQVSGDVSGLNQLDIDLDAKSLVDESIGVERAQSEEIVDGALYLAKKDFGILEFWQQNPKADGRGVTVGVFDDGISPHQSGFKVTTTGERKFLKRGTLSSLSTYTLTKKGDVFEGEIVEDIPTLGAEVDLNGDGKITRFNARVSDKVCLDLNVNGSFEESECRGTFESTGEYFMLPGTVMSIMAEFDATTGKLRLSQPEQNGDFSL